MSNFKKMAEFINGIQPEKQHCDTTSRSDDNVVVKNKCPQAGQADQAGDDDTEYEDMMKPIRRIFRMAPVYKNDK